MAASEPNGNPKLLATSRSNENHAADQSFVTGLQSELYVLQQRLSEVEGALQALDECWLSRKRPIIEEVERVHDSIDECQHKLHDALASPQNQSALQEAFKFVDGNVFTTISAAIIILNCVFMVLEATSHDSENQYLFCCANNIFLFWYFVELGLRGLHHQSGLFFGSFSNVWWNWLDALIIFCGVGDQLLLPLLAGHTQRVHPLVMRSLRLFRLLRVLRVLKLIRIFLQSDVSWVEGHKFESFMLTLIMANAVIMGLELDIPWCGWTWVDNLFLVAYVFELVARFRLLGWSYFSMHRPGIATSYLDVVIVGAGILEQWLTPAISLVEIHLLGYSKSSFHLGHELRILRILRICRILRIYRVVRVIKPLYVLMGGILEALQGMQWVFILAFLMLYSCSILFTNLIGHGYAFDGHPPPAAKETFGTVIDSMLALFKLMNADQSVIEPIISSPGGRMMSAGFMVVSNWAMLAILTSVVSDKIIAASQKTDAEDELMMAREIKTQRAKRLRALFAEVDKEGSGRCTKEQFKTMFLDHSMQVELCDASASDIDRLVEAFNIMAQGPLNKKYIQYESFITHILDVEKSKNAQSLVHNRMHLGLIERQLQTGLGRALELLGLNHDEIHALVGTEQLVDSE